MSLVPVTIVALTKEVLRIMFKAQLNKIALALLVATIAVTGARVLAQQKAGGDPSDVTARERPAGATRAGDPPRADGLPGSEPERAPRRSPVAAVRYLSPINNSLFFGIKPNDHLITALLYSPVAEEVGLTVEQIEAMKAIHNPAAREGSALIMRLRSPSSPGYDPDAIRAEMVAQQARLDAELAAVLDPAQRRRLEEIALQTEGPAALVRPEVAVRLGLSDPRMDGIRKAIAEMWAEEVRLKAEHFARARAFTEAIHQLDPKSPQAEQERQSYHDRRDETRAALGRNREQAFRKIADNLEPGQRESLRKMLGAPYDVSKLRNESLLLPVSWWQGR